MNYQRLLTSFKQVPTIGKIALTLAILLLISVIIMRYAPVKEGFMQNQNFLLHEGSKVFDEFYVNVYDALVFNEVKNNYEIGEIMNKTNPDDESIIVDIGSGTGHHVGKLVEQGFNASGFDISPHMVSKAKQNYPNAEFKVADALDSNALPPESVTHLLCLYLTLYYFKNKRQFFENCYNWLMPGGYLAIHLVNKDKFDPILPAGNPLDLVSVQDYTNERITETNVKFDGFEYRGIFEQFPNDLARYKEIFTDDNTKKVRQNEHVLYMQTQKEILGEARDAGFLVLAQIDLLSVSYDYQYVYILQKPT